MSAQIPTPTVYKSHGLGNDYLIWEMGGPLTADQVKLLCHRHLGVGGDGLLEPTVSTKADFGVKIWNPDGSIAEKSGNGLRIFAHWLVNERAAKDSFSVDTGYSVVQCRVTANSVSVEMGCATFQPNAIPIAKDEPMINALLALRTTVLRVTCVGMGNPHCVCFVEQQFSEIPWESWGEEVETHSLFPNRTNVQFVNIVNEGLAEVRIFERGAGHTLASGSSACAVAAAAVKTGRWQPGRKEIRMEGGSAFVTVSENFDVILEGAVMAIGRFSLSSALAASIAF